MEWGGGVGTATNDEDGNEYVGVAANCIGGGDMVVSLTHLQKA